MDLFYCPTCSMAFKSSLLLMKHKDKFCIGRAVVKASRSPPDVHEKMGLLKGTHGDLSKQHLKLESTEMFNSSGARPQRWIQKPNSEPTKGKSETLWSPAQASWAEVNGKHVVDLSNENTGLDKQRREIDLKLQELATHTKNASQLERILFEMKAQEQRNTVLLESVVDQLQHIQMDPRNNEKVEHKYVPIYGGGPLCADISALHHFYLQNGGNNSLILVQLQSLLTEALRFEMNPEQRSNPLDNHREKTKWGRNSNWNPVSRQLIAMEIENQRLEEEFRKAKLRKTMGSMYTSSRHTNEHKLRSMKMDIDLLKHELELGHLRRQIRTRKIQHSPALPPVVEPSSQMPALIKYYLDSQDDLAPAPYDPIAGFVVFYDFLLGLCPSYRVCRIMVGLYSGDQALASPSLLPPAYCETAILENHVPQLVRGHVAILATTQAVPRVHPSTSVSLVLKLHASGGYETCGQEVAHLTPRGWVKMDIFDNHNCVNSGRWKVPVRILPTKPCLTPGEINAVPQLDNTEMYLRIVNARDAETQSSTPVSYSNVGLYRYPPVMTRQCSGRPAFQQSSHAPRCLNDQPVFMECKDVRSATDTLLDDTE